MFPYRDEISKKLHHKRRRDASNENVEKYVENIVEVDVEPLRDNEEMIHNHNNEMRWMIYRAIEEYADKMGYNGRDCLLHAICEIAAVPFTFSSGILGELFHIIMT